MIRYATALLCILLFSTNAFTQNFFALYYGDKRIAFKDSAMLIVGGCNYKNTVWPCYWKNDKKVILGNEPGYVSSVYVEGDDIYMSGFIFQKDNTTKPCYWKNDTLNLLPDGGWAYSIIKDKQDVYMSGVHQKEHESFPCYWRNGNLVKLSEDYGEAYSIFTTNSGDLYFAGKIVYSVVGKAVYWKNGEMIRLSKIGSEARSIFVSDNDIYVVGEFGGGRRPKCWKNNEGCKLINKAQYVSTVRDFDGDIYVGGSQKGLDFKSCYWKNGELNRIPDTKGIIISIEEHDSDIYFLSLYVLPDKLEFSYWKDGEKISLEN